MIEGKGVVESAIGVVLGTIVLAIWGYRSDSLREVGITGVLVVIVLAIWGYRSDSLREVGGGVLAYIGWHRHLLPSKLQRKLRRRILASQTLSGRQKGQFGKSIEAAEDRRWQLVGAAREDMSTKPRMYLTLWPVIVLRRRGLARARSSLAATGIRRTFQDNKVLVAQASVPNMSPMDPTARIVSYRHTMAGALILQEYGKWNRTTRAVIDAMLDPKNAWGTENAWGTPSGGWFAAEGAKDVDLWASAYAAKLLVRVVSCPGPAGFSPRERSEAERKLDATLSFLNCEWTKKQWAYGKLKSEESAVVMFIEVFPVLCKRDPRLLDLCLSHFRKEWLTPTGNLSDEYLKRLKNDPVLGKQLLVRMAYAFYLAGDARIWRGMFDSASRGNLDGLQSAELAFLLDMSWEMTESW